MDSLQFLFKIDSISPNYDEQPENRGPDQNWKPPTIRRAFLTERRGKWYRWVAGGVYGPVSNIGGADHGTCSLFYNAESAQFLGVPFDCRNYSVEKSAREGNLGWRRLMFRHMNYNYGDTQRPLSIVKLHEESSVLASRTRPYWMPQLLPTTFRRNDYDPSYVYNGVEVDTGLAGDLSLMLALAAFSGPSYCMEETIRASFKPPIWCLHQFAEEKEHGRGLVVSICTDPEAFPMTSQKLGEYEDGVYGGMIV